MKPLNLTVGKGWGLVLWLLFIISLTTGPARGGQGMSPDADRILQSMSAYLGGLKTFSMNADIDFEIVSQTGQKLQLSSLATVVLQRPAKFHITRKGMLADVELIFDGKTLILYGKNLNAYAQIETPGSIDDAIRAYELETGLPAPGADLLFADSHAILSGGVESSAHIGIAYVNGVECYHLAFREAKVDWQLWVKTGDEPLPMKYVITSKWQTGAPQYEIRLRDWKVRPQIKAEQFSFSVPDDAIKLETMPVNDMGEFSYNEEDK